MILFAMTGHYSCSTSKICRTIVHLCRGFDFIRADDSATKNLADYCIVGGGITAGGQSRDRPRDAFSARESIQKVKRNKESVYSISSSFSFLPSFLMIRIDRRRSALTADAYEADVKTFVKYEGIASRKIDSSAPSRMKGRATRGASHC